MNNIEGPAGAALISSPGYACILDKTLEITYEHFSYILPSNHKGDFSNAEVLLTDTFFELGN